jgi:poly-gamma-glutamate synthesis protein (capsule biosynthesis protein)
MSKLRLSLIIFVLLLLIVFLTLRYRDLSSKNQPQNFSPLSTILPPRSTPTPTPMPTVTFGLMGDLGLGRHITSTARQKNNFNWSFQEISPWLKQNDFNLANLESPIISNCPEGKTGTFTFCGDERFLPYLKENKFIFNLANNHILNYGMDGLSQTKAFLNQNNITYFYSHQNSSEFNLVTVNGIKFGFLGYDLVTYGSKLTQVENEIFEKISKYDSEVDWLIVSLHWGNEYLESPEDWRVKLAHQLIDRGVDMVVGHHPHVLQKTEVYKDKYIFYSLGNFVFDQNWSKETSASEMVRITVNKNNTLNIEKAPILIKFNSQPQLISP